MKIKDNKFWTSFDPNKGNFGEGQNFGKETHELVRVL